MIESRLTYVVFFLGTAAVVVMAVYLVLQNLGVAA